MNEHELFNILGSAFASGNVAELKKYLSDGCDYTSDYSHTKLFGADEIVRHLEEVYSNLSDDCAYKYTVVELEDILNGLTVESLDNIPGNRPCEKALLLYQFGASQPVAVVTAMVDAENAELLKSILLSRSREWFNITFYDDAANEPDSPDDLPSTVKALTTHDRHVAELQYSFSGQHLQEREEAADNCYIWREADKYIKDLLDKDGYQVLESRIFEDCIGYRCARSNELYTVYMYAYGQHTTVYIDGEFCAKLLSEDFSSGSTVLVSYVHVYKNRIGQKASYSVVAAGDGDDRKPELWKVTPVAEKVILQFFPGREMIDLIDKFMYAFNRESMDVYECIITEKNPGFEAYDSNGIVMNFGFYSKLQQLHHQYGDMKIGYVRYNDIIYSKVPYLEGYGYFGFSAYNKNHRIHDVYSRAFDSNEFPAQEFLRTAEREPDDLFDFLPKLVSVEALPPIHTERFALKLYYDNGQCIKYILPIPDENENDEVVSFDWHAFTDKIWHTAEVRESRKAQVPIYPVCGQCIGFKNEYTISSLQCYLFGESYSEPKKESTIIFEDRDIRLTKAWSWDITSIYFDGETGLMKVLLSGQAFNWYAKSTFADLDTLARCTISFDYIDGFAEGFARVYKSGYGYGYINSQMKFVIPMKYEEAGDFSGGKARVKRNGTWYYIDSTGRETLIDTKETYQEVCSYKEGLCRVSTLKLRFMDLAYYSDYESIAGTWGFVDESGREVIPPQYIFANDFQNGIALVCKGKWTLDKKWDNEYNKNKYWTDEQLWGGIDRHGNEVIPFVFDEIRCFEDTDDVFAAHYGGWKDGKWGVIDNHGHWLADPVFGDIHYEYHDGLFAFSEVGEDEDGWEDTPYGIYDTKQQSVVFKPQFTHVHFLDDGWIEVETFDEELGRSIEKLIDINGNEKFHSVYSGIYAWKYPYEVYIRDEAGNRHGLIDEYGNVILPCKYDIPFDGISAETRTIRFRQGEKMGVCDFDGNVLIEPKYDDIYRLDKPLITVVMGGEEEIKSYGLVKYDGTEVLPPIYAAITWLSDDKVLLKKDGVCEIAKLELNAKESI